MLYIWVDDQAYSKIGRECRVGDYPSLEIIVWSFLSDTYHRRASLMKKPVTLMLKTDRAYKVKNG